MILNFSGISNSNPSCPVVLSAEHPRKLLPVLAHRSTPIGQVVLRNVEGLSGERRKKRRYELRSETQPRDAFLRQLDADKDRILEKIRPKCCQFLRGRSCTMLDCICGLPELVQLAGTPKTLAVNAQVSQPPFEVRRLVCPLFSPSQLSKEEALLLFEQVVEPHSKQVQHHLPDA